MHGVTGLQAKTRGVMLAVFAVEKLARPQQKTYRQKTFPTRLNGRESLVSPSIS